MMKILIADDMEYARANIMELVKNIFPEAEIDAFSDGTHAWDRNSRKKSQKNIPTQKSFL